MFNYVSGKLVGNPLKGGANSITILRPNTFEGNLAAFHNHTKKDLMPHQEKILKYVWGIIGWIISLHYLHMRYGL